MELSKHFLCRQTDRQTDRHIWRCDPQEEEEEESPYKQLQIQWQQSTVMLEVLRSSWTFALRYKRRRRSS